MTKRPLKILLAGPRGFCAGVDRAIQIVELAIEKHGPPVYVRHEIVHNRYVVEDLETKGAIFVEELDEVPEGVPVVFSAHGVPKSVFSEADERDIYYLDATCPLVTKVHVDAARHEKAGKDLILIGHAGHPEVIGTMGQMRSGEMVLVENVEQAASVKVPNPDNLAFVTQTTLSVDDTSEIIGVLQRRFPSIEAPRKEDICYATTNRQAAVKELADKCEAMIVLGAPNSSNSNRLAEVALTIGCPKSILIQSAAEIEDGWLDDVSTLGITAGASAPEILVQELIDTLSGHFDLTIEERNTVSENVTFSLPRELTA
ncbi:MAG: 4-hydroxy-3-methylbut-2-enyl diphosphate reductase [Rhodospirillaceae bacterium]|nr:4-hydroxy-3-methylbut-2-enyl diphosphate reductase [Rhodospirillaceae bacterium]